MYPQHNAGEEFPGGSLFTDDGLTGVLLLALALPPSVGCRAVKAPEALPLAPECLGQCSSWMVTGREEDNWKSNSSFLFFIDEYLDVFRDKLPTLFHEWKKEKADFFSFQFLFCLKILIPGIGFWMGISVME